MRLLSLCDAQTSGDNYSARRCFRRLAIATFRLPDFRRPYVKTPRLHLFFEVIQAGYNKNPRELAGEAFPS